MKHMVIPEVLFSFLLEDFLSHKEKFFSILIFPSYCFVSILFSHFVFSWSPWQLKKLLCFQKQ
jgi:hypothetical protein